MHELLEQTAGEIDDVLTALAGVSGMPSVLLTQVEGKSWRVWAAHAEQDDDVLSRRELPVEMTYCRSVCLSDGPVVVSDAEWDERFQDHPAFRELGVVSYVGVPFRIGDGPTLGALCAYDRRPHVGLDRVIPHFELLARLLSHELRWAAEARTSHAALLRETETAAARERFLASVAHDLRTPLAAIRMSANLVLRGAHAAERVIAGAARVLHAADRMARLIDDLLDFARGRLGAGIPVFPEAIDDAARLVEDVLEETTMAFPQRDVRWSFALPRVSVRWDRDRVAQCIENLVVNACEHGAQDAPVHISLDADERDVRLEILNGGEIIAGRISHLDPFGPRARGAAGGGTRLSGRRGLGLGLYIADRIARAHGGSVSLQSQGGQTRTVLHLPRATPALRGTAA